MLNFFKKYLLHITLFIATLYSTTYSGGELIELPVDTYEEYLLNGLYFSIPFLTFLTVHEFGHYITARLYKIKVSLPYYLPFFGLIGTMGAFIKIKTIPQSRKQFFDVGIAGPLAGFVVGVALLVYGFTHLPPADHIFKIHKEYKQYGANYADKVYSTPKNDSTMLLSVGGNLLFTILEKTLVEDPSLMPNSFEIMHYPFLFSGFLALFFTALNLLPIGQLDGGHVIYGLLGIKNHKRISDGFLIILVLIGGVGLFNSPLFWEDFVPLDSFENFMVFSPIYLLFLYWAFFSRISEQRSTNILISVLVFITQYAVAELWTEAQGFLGYLIFGFLISKFLGTGHPITQQETPLDTGRKILGWFAVLVFILCFSFQPIYVVS